MAILYALVKDWESNFSETCTEIERIDGILLELDQRDPEKWSRFISYASKVKDISQLISLSVFLEREQKLQLKDEDFLCTITVDKFDTKKAKASQIPLYLVLDDIRSSFNVGSIFRMADCIGIKKIFLCGYTASPENEKIKKAAMGAESFVEWEFFEDKKKLLRYFREEKIEILGLETSNSAINHSDYEPSSAGQVLWVGNERFGIDEKLLERFDKVLRVPLYGRKNSLNVAQALCVVAFPLGEKLREIHG